MFLRYSSELSDLADLSIVIEGTSESNKDMYTEMSVEHDGDTLISLTDTFKTKKSSPVDIPDNYCSMEEWADDLDPNYLMYRLIDAGVSRSVVQPNSYRYSY